MAESTTCFASTTDPSDIGPNFLSATSVTFFRTSFVARLVAAPISLRCLQCLPSAYFFVLLFVAILGVLYPSALALLLASDAACRPAKSIICPFLCRDYVYIILLPFHPGRVPCHHFAIKSLIGWRAFHKF